MNRSALIERISRVKDYEFEALALDIFHYQATHNPIYAQFIDLLGVAPENVKQLTEVPFLPIELFKQYELQAGAWKSELVFTSSGTTGSTTSSHLVKSSAWYLQNARRGFEQAYGPLSNFAVLALLPSYLERSGSSLILMAEDFIAHARTDDSGFFLYDHKALLKRIAELQARAQPPKILLLGVSFALLDLAEAHPQPLTNTIIMETGGMKGRRKEITRKELHKILSTAFGQQSIHSEYGMTELLSQAYSPGQGIFYGAPTLRVLARQITDPRQYVAPGRTGVANLIDLANLDTISFIAAQDLTRVHADGSFEILGRLDASDVRGCNLMVI